MKKDAHDQREASDKLVAQITRQMQLKDEKFS
jgi:hypothetical protein